MEKLTLEGVLESFNAPINEEQAWAVCYQCTKHLQARWRSNPGDCFRFNKPQCIEIGKDGSIVNILADSEITPESAETEYEVVQSLGVVVFQALDYGLDEEEEQKLSPALEALLEKMTGSESDEEGDNGGQNEGEADEGIEHDAGDEEMSRSQKITFNEVLKMCTGHLASPLEATAHYKAVCRALVAEAQELRSFLEKISKERDKLKTTSEDDEDNSRLEELQRHDWARLWMQIMRDLRNGVKLKKIDFTHQQSMEFELTPYEILMEDIRSRRYSLKQVMVNAGLPARRRKDAHDIILEFIRSRPPLQPAKDRILSSPPPRPPDVREEILEAIRSEPKLRPTPGRYSVETSRTKLDEEDNKPAPMRKVIKVDPSLFMTNSFDEEEEDEDEADGGDLLEDRNKVAPSPLPPLTPLEPDTPKVPTAAQPWQQTVALDILQALQTPPERRHSITVCETPTSPTPQRPFPSSLECLSLTVEEVMHIRNVLTKAELECLVVDPELQALLAKGKVCFTCKQTRFSLFGQWGTKCKFCRRTVCSKCCSKMRIPTEHFEHIPVYTLSPSPLSPARGQENITAFTYEKPGSVPSSPDTDRKDFSPPPDVLNNNNRRRAPLQRSQTMARPASLARRSSLQGPLMNVCTDCKAMVLNIIRASRTSLANAPDMARQRFPIPEPPSHKAERNFHLELKPVYKT